MLTLGNFDVEINQTIVHRGKAYFENNAVEYLEEDPAGTWLATVEGTEDYEVEIVFSNKAISATSCDCPYDGGPICKHIVAVLYALRDQIVFAPIKPGKGKKPARLGFEGVLAKVSLEELRDFVRHQEKGNREFRNRFLLYFSEKDPSVDVYKKYQSLVRQMVRTHSDRGFMDYRHTYSFSNAMDAVLDDATAVLAKQNHQDAFAIGKVVCEEAIQVLQMCDDSAGNVGAVVAAGVEILKTVAEVEGLSPELRDQLLGYATQSLAEDQWMDYGDFGYDLMNVVKGIAQNTDPDIYLNLLDKLLKTHTGKYSDYKQNYFKVEKIKCLESIGRTAEAKKLVAENMDIVKVRKGEVQKALAKKDFAQAKDLIAEGIEIAESKKHPGTVSSWEELLLEIARQENDVDTIRHFTKKYAFERGFSQQHYQAWKASYSPEEWSKTINQHIGDVILREETKPKRAAWDHLSYALFSQLSPIYTEEKMWPELLGIIPEEPSENTLSRVHPHLAKRYPVEMLAFYLEMLTQLADEVHDRKGYQHLTSLMKKVKQDIAGSHPAIDKLVITLMKKYPRRPAMLEELRKVVSLR